MKKWIIAVLCCISITAFADKKPVQSHSFQPPSFKQDWENYQTYLISKANDLASPNADSIAIYEAIKAETDLLESKWDIDEQMKNAKNVWQTITCMAGCTYTYYQCQKNPGNEQVINGMVHFWPKDCFAVFGGCTIVRNCY